MKILMTLENDFSPDIRVEKEIRTLTSAGYEIVLACITRTGKDEIIRQGLLTIHRKRIPEFIYKTSVAALKFPLYFNFWRAFLQSLYSKQSFDLIHVHDLPLARVAIEIRERREIPVLLDLHENYPWLLQVSHHTQTLAGKLLSSHEQWVRYEREMVCQADIILSVIEEQRERLIELGAAPERIYLVSNTPELSDIPGIGTGKGNDKFVFVYAGNFGANRGIEIVFSALKEVVSKSPAFLLRLVGNGKRTTHHLKKMADDLSLSEQIDFCGWQPYEKMLNFIAEGDVAILPHLKNPHSDHTIPNKLFQYMMLAKPVIASNCKPIKRIIEKTDSGYIYQDRDHLDLSEKMLYAVNNRQEIILKGKNGRKAVQEIYNWQRSGENLLAAYKAMQ
jgi:glycosyltransferase involved in cell wall biosynthesis